MSNSIELITKYSKDALDSVLAVESRTQDLVNGKKFVDLNFKEAGYVKIMSILMDGLSDYHRVNHEPEEGTTGYSHYNANGDGSHRDGYAVGGVDAQWEIFHLAYDRGKQFQIDAMDNEETAGKVIAGIETEFLKTKVVPEIDEVRFARIASKASTTLGNLVTGTIEANTIVAKLNEGFEFLSELEVPEEEQIIFASPAVITLMRNTTEINKFITQDDLARDVNFTVMKYMGRRIIEVPSNRFFTDPIIGENGYYPSTTSKVINFMIVSKRCVVPVVKLEKLKIWTPETIQDFDGYKVNFRLYHDCIVPKNKQVGVYCHVSATNAKDKASRLNVAISWNGSKNVVDAYYTRPVGLRGKLVHQSGAMVAGTAYPSAEEIQVGVPYTKKASTEHYALLDSNNVAVAVSGAIVVPAE